MSSRLSEFLIMNIGIVAPLALLAMLVLFKSARVAMAGFLRVFARLLLLAATVAIVYDGTRTIAGGAGLVITPLAEHWQALAPASLALLQKTLSGLHPLAWSRGGLVLVSLPAWLVLGVFGLLLAWIGAKRREIEIFVN
ncbi:MAG: hypothetical protein R3D68_12640 [Hyphomicrobiaceae bacterium]